MPRNIGGGRNYKKKKTKVPAGPSRLLYPDKDQLYGIVLKRLGNGWLNLVVCDNTGAKVQKVLGKIRGSLLKISRRFREGSYVIASGRPFESGSGEKIKVDVIHLYGDEDKRTLDREKRIPNDMKREASLLNGGTSSANKGDDSDDEFGVVFDTFAEENAREMDDADIDAL